MNSHEFENKFHDEYQKLSETNCQKFGKIVEKMLGSTFILRSRDEDYQDYVFISEHQTLFENFFQIIAEEFINNKLYSFAYVKSISGRLHVRLRKFDTLILLLLRSSFHQKMADRGSFDNVVQISVGELIEKASQTSVIDDKGLTKKSYYVDTLVKLRKHRIIDYSTSQISDDTIINILPSILVLIPQDSLESISEMIRRLGKSKDDSEGGEEDEETE